MKGSPRFQTTASLAFKPKPEPKFNTRSVAYRVIIFRMLLRSLTNQSVAAGTLSRVEKVYGNI